LGDILDGGLDNLIKSLQEEIGREEL
jgi:hypothetical protein